MKKILSLFYLLCILMPICAQSGIQARLIDQGAWFLFSVRTDEIFNDNRLYTKVDFFKKSDVSSIFFDKNDKVYSVFSKEGTDVNEDLWQLVDDTHFVMVSPVDGSPQVMNILQLDSSRLVFRNCSDIEDGTRCIIYTYFVKKEGWLPDGEIEELNSVGVIDVNSLQDATEE